MIQIPIGIEDEFKGTIDLINMKAVYHEGSRGYFFLPDRDKAVIVKLWWKEKFQTS